MSKQIVPEEVLSEMWQFMLKTSAVSELLKKKVAEQTKRRDKPNEHQHQSMEELNATSKDGIA